MLNREIDMALNEVISNIPEDDTFKHRFRKLIENALIKTQERSFRDDDLRELIELIIEEDQDTRLFDEGGIE